MAARATNKKFITTFHGIYNITGFLKRYYNSIMTEGEKIIAVSNFVKKHILTNYDTNEEKIRVIHRGVDHNYFDPDTLNDEQLIKFKEKYNVPANVPVILLPSRMTAWKGHLVLIEALSLIKHLNFYCLLVGDLSKHPNFNRRVQEKIAEHKLQSKVQIFGNESDMIKLYGISDIVLSTSIEPEAFGRTIIEGQSMKKLVIATNIGSAAETIVDKVTGFHVIPNDPKDLAEKVNYCLSILGTDKESEIVDAARKSSIQNFSLDLMLSKTLDVYRELI
jgi:glycosyltransferase involved in cell wall biosynthesis